jgi:hypothetical protein
MADTDAFSLKHGKKITYFDHRRWLVRNHSFRSDTSSFRKGKEVTKGPPKRLKGEEVLEWLNSLEESDEGGFLGYGEEHHWTHKSFLWELPYAQALMLPHNIDLMHQERNVACSLINMLFDVKDKTRDNLNARKDIAVHCDRPWLEVTVNAKGKECRPRAPYCLTTEDRK